MKVFRPLEHSRRIRRVGGGVGSAGYSRAIGSEVEVSLSSGKGVGILVLAIDIVHDGAAYSVVERLMELVRIWLPYEECSHDNIVADKHCQVRRVMSASRIGIRDDCSKPEDTQHNATLREESAKRPSASDWLAVEICYLISRERFPERCAPLAAFHERIIEC